MESVIRVAVAYVALMIGFRVLGKRELSQLSPFDLVTIMLMPEMISEALRGEDASMTAGLIGLATLFTLVFLSSLLSYRFKAAQHVIQEPPTVLVRHGKIVTEQLDRERVTADEVLSEMHQAGIERLADVRWGILESDGRLSFITQRTRHPEGRQPVSKMETP